MPRIAVDSEDVDVVLHWMNGAANDLNDLTTLLVVGLSENDIWESYGNGGTTGGTGAGESGSVSSALGDPPPFGIVNFTIGSTEAFTTDVDELQFEKDQILSVYPNPVDDILNVKTDKTITDEGMLEVFDISGRRIYSKKCIIENGRLQLSSNTINARSAGLYLIRFTTAEESHICKFHKR